jgi:hypothetical protein
MHAVYYTTFIPRNTWVKYFYNQAGWCSDNALGLHLGGTRLE